MKLTLVSVLFAAACAPQVAATRPLLTRSQQAAARPKLGWIAWQDESSVLYCNRRVDDDGNPIGVLGPCKQRALGGDAKSVMSWLNSESPDSASQAPAGCAVDAVDADLVQHKPARAEWVAPSGRAPLDEWQPDPKLQADVYRIEASFSPEGQTLALAHVAIHVGEGERIIEFADVKLLAMPACN